MPTRAVGSLRVNYANFDCENCQNAFIAGAFLSCGTVSSPKSDYHLEFTVPYQNLAASFVTMLEEKELKPGLTNRKGYHILYFKGSEAIEDCLYLMGASGAMFEMMNVKIVKDIRNSANRKANCETANIERMVQAVRVQLDAIEKIRRLRGLEYLSEDLHAMAHPARGKPGQLFKRTGRDERFVPQRGQSPTAAHCRYCCGFGRERVIYYAKKKEIE